MNDTTVYMKDYQPPVFGVKHITLTFDLHDDYALVESQMTLNREHQGVLRLHGEALELISIDMDGKRLDESNYSFDEENLVINECPDELTLTLVTRIYPQNNTQLSGLYRSNQLFCTQCEAEGFRRITYFPDRPDVLTIFTTKIIADKQKYPILLSNGNLIDSGEASNGRHWVVWQDPFKKPSYLFALVAGDLASVNDTFVTQSGKQVDLKIYVEPGNEDKCQHAMQSLKHAMRWDEEVYGLEYDLSIFMIVAVSDFNMGAMENKGLNIFNSKYILAKPDSATDEDFAGVESVVAHEYFHNWTGNRVTCRDWFQLSLKEGLTVFRDQEFSRDMNSRDVNRILDVKALRATQFPEDASAMAHPVRPAAYQEINNFYTATIYNKGAEVIRMQHTLLGKEGFRRGMDLYFKRHDGQAVTIDDFVSAMEDANQVDFTQFKRWYDQAGTPEVQVTSDYVGDTLTLKLTQACAPTPECQVKKPFHIPLGIALFDKQGQRLAIDKEIIELKEASQTVTFSGIHSKPVVSLLRGFSAPIRLKQQRSQEDTLDLLRFETDGYAKWDAAKRLALEGIHTLLTNATWALPHAVSSAFQQVLSDETLDMALRAELLALPCFEEVIADLKEVDVEKIEKARDGFRQQLGSLLYDSLESTYQTLWASEDNSMSGIAYGRRKLRNVCLWFMMKADETRAIECCKHQFSKAQTMSDELASFVLLASAKKEGERETVIQRFYEQWLDDDLVMDKWFSIQASSELPDTLNNVKGLLTHPLFSMKNPNKVRALIGAFSQANPRNFHAKDGSGYAFLGEMLTSMDAINPQIAARLATPFTRWQHYDSLRQQLMQNELKQLSSNSLSKDLDEVVSKSLIDA